VENRVFLLFLLKTLSMAVLASDLLPPTLAAPAEIEEERPSSFFKRSAMTRGKDKPCT